MNRLPLSKTERRQILQAPGRYGRTAMQHGVRLSQWGSVNMLARHGASIGHSGDGYGVIDGILKAAREGREKGGSWRNVDRTLSDLWATCSSLHGDSFATCKPRDSESSISARDIDGTTTSLHTYQRKSLGAISAHTLSSLAGQSSQSLAQARANSIAFSPRQSMSIHSIPNSPGLAPQSPGWARMNVWRGNSQQSSEDPW